MFGINKNFICLGLLLGCVQKSVAPTNNTAKPSPTAQPATQKEEPVAVKTVSMIQQTWSGRFFSQQFIQEPDPATLPKKQLIIRDEQSFAKFVGRIPQKEIQKTNPAPKSSDPFINGLQIDFQTAMLLVSIRDENMYAMAPITGVYEEEDKLVAKIQMKSDPENAMMSSMSGIGTYYAVQIPATDKEIVFAIEK